MRWSLKVNSELCQLQETDPTLSVFRKFWSRKKKPTHQERVALSKSVLSLLKQWMKIKAKEGLLYHVF